MASVKQELLGPLSEDAACDLHLLDGVGDREALEDGHSVRDTIAGVDNETSGATGSVKRHHSLDGDVEVIHIELLEHDFSHPLSVTLGVPGGLSDKNTLALGWVASELVGEGPVPNLLHVRPVVNNTRLDGVVELENTSL